MSEIELKPCPFCGSKAAQQNYVVEAVVHCTSCFAVIRRTHAPTVDTGIAASAEAWNARAALTPPEGYVLVPVEPTPGRLMSMAIRSDHALGCPGYYDQELLRYPGAPTHQQQLDSAIREARAQYEEVVGAGFYSHEKEADYVAMLAARPEVSP